MILAEDSHWLQFALLCLGTYALFNSQMLFAWFLSHPSPQQKNKQSDALVPPHDKGWSKLICSSTVHQYLPHYPEQRAAECFSRSVK